ncbi:hypothetical protein [Microbispora rosea]|nr:hypothetical protein [Microbispora rosea]GIH44849.1 hypothetical protein Mro03_00280 [Microbispora rosea subsp. rosea]
MNDQRRTLKFEIDDASSFPHKCHPGLLIAVISSSGPTGEAMFRSAQRTVAGRNLRRCDAAVPDALPDDVVAMASIEKRREAKIAAAA